MNWIKKVTFIFSAPFQILLVTIIIVVMFGVMDSQADLVSDSVDLYGGTAAASFHASTVDGEFGAANKGDLEERINGGCYIDEPGFREGEEAWIVLDDLEKALDRECIDISMSDLDDEDVEDLNYRILQTPLYSKENQEYFYPYVSTLKKVGEEQ